jgi:hypothetical protein
MSSTLGKFIVPFGFFATGAVCEMYTGTKVITQYKDNKKDKKVFSYDYTKGTGIGWGAALAILTLPSV